MAWHISLDDLVNVDSAGVADVGDVLLKVPAADEDLGTLNRTVSTDEELDGLSCDELRPCLGFLLRGRLALEISGVVSMVWAIWRRLLTVPSSATIRAVYLL